MHVFELHKPGVWLDGIDDADEQREVEMLLHLLATCVDDAAVSLWLFETAQDASRREPVPDWEEERRRESMIAATLESELPLDLSFQDRWAAMDRIREEARVRARREAWASGIAPRSYMHRLPFIHAKSCLYALDTLQMALRLLAKKPNAPVGVGDYLQSFESSFPELRAVRNSAHHIEDRIQGKSYDKPIALLPVENAMISAPGGALVVDSLTDNRFGGTLADGSFGEVEVSQQSVAAAARIVQGVLDAYSWCGPSQHLPL